MAPYKSLKISPLTSIAQFVDSSYCMNTVCFFIFVDMNEIRYNQAICLLKISHKWINAFCGTRSKRVSKYRVRN